jgi:hypothetical protein
VGEGGGVGVNPGVSEGEGEATGGVPVGVGVLVGVGVDVGVGVGGTVGVGVGDAATPQAFGPRIATVMGAPVLKNPIVACVAMGAWSESKRKLYIVPQRMAFAFWFWAKVSELQLTKPADWMGVHGALL